MIATHDASTADSSIERCRPYGLVCFALLPSPHVLGDLMSVAPPAFLGFARFFALPKGGLVSTKNRHKFENSTSLFFQLLHVFRFRFADVIRVEREYIYGIAGAQFLETHSR